MRGVSIFLGQRSQEQINEYLTTMKEHGFQTIFTSLHIPEDDSSMYIKELKQLGEWAVQHNMELIADISPSSLSLLGSSIEIKGLSGLRIDYGIGAEEIVRLSKVMRVVLNASTLTDSFFEELLEKGLNLANVEAWHNYYPRPETGLAKHSFIQKNRQLKQCGIKIAAFVPGEGEKRGPINKGLPTLEQHRHVSPFAAAVELWRECGVDKVIIGDPWLSKESAQTFSTYDKGVITFRTTFLKASEPTKELIEQVHYERLDSARDVIRSATSRSYAQTGKFHVPIVSTVERPRGSITIDNERYGRYQGELQITKKSLPAHDAVNVVGYVVPEDQLLLDVIKPGEGFCFRCTEA
ncbi:DUF871 domain-containing protein [Alkalihalobacillus sp. 1P02AB]|uniref:DUF871 domain-containing protein n=1 Tax=Alkalihalobacillus sp. 1P02AB TaxID=3132260 RepID=UPI0039A684A1